MTSHADHHSDLDLFNCRVIRVSDLCSHLSAGPSTTGPLDLSAGPSTTGPLRPATVLLTAGLYPDCLGQSNISPATAARCVVV